MCSSDLAELVGPCGGSAVQIGEALPDSLVASLAAPLANGPAAAGADVGRAPNRSAAMILIVAIVLMVLEIVVRRRTGGLVMPARQPA